MNERSEYSSAPGTGERLNGRHPEWLSGAQLKWIAIVTMAIDHFAASILKVLLQRGMGNPDTLMDVYRVMRNAGRLAFPIYCFMLVEGFLHTRSRKNYLRNLVLFGCISEIPFDLALSQTVFAPAHQNVFFTLALGLASIWAIDEVEKRRRGVTGWLIAVLIIVAVFSTAQFCHVDYSGYGPLVIIVLYSTRKNRLLQCVAGALLFAFIPGEFPWALLSFVMLYTYNGKRGRQHKWFFYGFYPVHLLIFGIISTLIARG